MGDIEKAQKELEKVEKVLEKMRRDADKHINKIVVEINDFTQDMATSLNEIEKAIMKGKIK